MYFFCQLRKQHGDPVLTLYGSPIPVIQEYKYLGLIFDKKLSFIPHIKYLVQIEQHFYNYVNPCSVQN